MVTKLEATDRLIFALDIFNDKEACTLLSKVSIWIGGIKVNFLAATYPNIIQDIRRKCSSALIWRDWKHHDIPGTVAEFIKADIKAGVNIITIHTLGGFKMMKAAVEAAQESNLKIFGVTILTSHDQKSLNEELGILGTIQDKVIQLALMAEKAGVNGIVASAQEAKFLRKVLKPETLIVTPGITPIWAVKREDQERVTTPTKAIQNGADYIVVGSAIYKSEDPAKAAEKIVKEIEQALLAKK